jgi:hypothetical protein
MVRWFRHYPGLARDERLMAVALRARQPVERVVWVWCAILEAASTTGNGGGFELDVDECAWFLRVPPDEIALVLQELEAAGRICDGRVTAWSRRQFASDRSAERTREWRQRHTANGSGKGRVTSPQRHRDAPETEAESETETETDTDLFGTDVPCALARRPKAPKPEHFAEIWNELAASIELPQIRKLTPQRRINLRNRIADYTVDEFREVLSKIPASPFLRGDTGWHGCTFDWVTKKTNFQKILEGNYDR